MFKKSSLSIIGCFVFAMPGFAQSNDVAVTFGATFSSSVTGLPICEAVPVCPAGPVDHSVEPGFSLVGAYSHRLINVKAASLHLELPVMFAPSRKADTARFNPDFSSFYFTPSLKLKLLPVPAFHRLSALAAEWPISTKAPSRTIEELFRWAAGWISNGTPGNAIIHHSE